MDTERFNKTMDELKIEIKNNGKKLDRFIQSHHESELERVAEFSILATRVNEKADNNKFMFTSIVAAAGVLIASFGFLLNFLDK